MEKLTTIITAFDHHDLTVAHVKASMDVSRIPDEIIVVNDHGDPSLKEMLKKIDRKCPLIYAYIENDILWNYNGACNLAVWLSRGDYLAFEDNDNFPGYTFYEEAIRTFKDNPNISRVQGTKRKVVSYNDLVQNYRTNWTQIGLEGPNMGTAMIPRHVFLDMKGHDERFCGQYGNMYTDWRCRSIHRYGKENYTMSAGEYFYTKEGQSDLPRPSYNRSFYLDNAHRIEAGGSHQAPDGILNFTYQYERWT